MPMGGPMSVGGICVVLVVLVDVRRFFLGFPPDWDPDGTRKLPPTILDPGWKNTFELVQVIKLINLRPHKDNKLDDQI